MKLSKENYDALKDNCLYKCEPRVDNSFSVGNIPATYHCKNWTFRVVKADDGRAWMRDTYFDSYDSHNIEVTDDNFNKFELVFCFSDVIRVPDSCIDEYDEKDLFCVATNSGGWSCGNLYWIKKGTPRSINMQIKKCENKIDSLKNNLRWAEEELKRLNCQEPKT